MAAVVDMSSKSSTCMPSSAPFMTRTMKVLMSEIQDSSSSSSSVSGAPTLMMHCSQTCAPARIQDMTRVQHHLAATKQVHPLQFRRILHAPMAPSQDDGAKNPAKKPPSEQVPQGIVSMNNSRGQSVPPTHHMFIFYRVNHCLGKLMDVKLHRS